MRPRFRSLLPLFALACALASAEASNASSHDLDAVRLAVRRGEIRPLAEVLTLVRSKLPGEIVGVEIERKDGRWLYEFRVANNKGGLFEVYVDARSGDIIRIKEK